MEKLRQRWQSFQFFSPILPTSEPVTLTHKRVYILPTKHGLEFVVIMFLVLLIAFIYNNNLAYLLAFLLGSVFFITILHSFKSLAGLVIYKGQTGAAFAGEPASFDIHISNLSKEPRFNLEIQLNEAVNFNLAAQQKHCVTLYMPTQKRGWLPCGKIVLSSTYPLGLFRAWTVLKFDSKALVYPKPAKELIEFPESSGIQNQHGQAKKGNDDFYGLTEYQAGDSIRQIHWKTFAKGLGLFSKQYGGEALAELWLNYDAAPGYATEQRLSCMCRWLVDADKGGLHYGFILPGVKIEPSSGTAHFKKCLEALALF
jgi:uncharacterized protein (DUF58 family)